jgi:dipeptidyl aminopeptidase/acylaminoacyl peptidase
MVAAATLTTCNDNKVENPIGRNLLEITDGVLTPNILNSFGRVSNPQVSPDGKTVLYEVSFPNIEQNKSNRELFTVNIDGSNNQQITNTAKSESNARWVKGGSKIAYLMGGQIWEMNPDGSGAQQISFYDGGINEFAYSPDGKKILFVSDVKYGIHVTDIYPDLKKANAHIAVDMNYRHWDEWVESVPHPFVADYDGKQLSNIIDLLEGEPYECPSKPFGDLSELAWSNDSKTIAYACRKKTGLDYALSTNTDIYLYNLETCTAENITEGMMGYDMSPQYSPDGQWIAWTSMERDGYEADQVRLFAMNLLTKEKINVTREHENMVNVDAFIWTPDSKGFYIQACIMGLTHIYELDLSDAKLFRQITHGMNDMGAPIQAGDLLVSLCQSMKQPNEVVVIDPLKEEFNFITSENKHLFDQLKPIEVEARWMTTTDNKKMLTWIVYPPDFDKSKKYPAVMMCMGGPQGTISQSWSYRWNYRLMAAQGYVVILPNRRGTSAFGKEWKEQISGDYPGQNMKDYITAADEMRKEPFIDANRIACTGASYGGYSVFWLAGHHQKRFRAFIAHSGIFNTVHKYMTTEELFFPNWDYGGAPWDKNNKIAQRTHNESPHLFVEKWDTPILITHGELDFRIPYDQAMAAFNAARMHGIPAELIIFPDENHWILKPQNSIFWHRMFYRFLDKWMQ